MAATAGAFAFVTVKPGLDRDRPLDEQADGFVRRRGSRGRCSRSARGRSSRSTSRQLARVRRRRQARDRVLLLARDAQGRPARDDEPTRSGSARSRSATIGAAADDLLEVVEHEQDALVAAASRPARRAVGRAPLSTSPTVAGDRAARPASGRGPARAGRRNAVRELVGGARRDLQREPRLAGPAGAGERQQAGRAEQAAASASSRSRPTNVVSCGRQVVRVGVERPERREVGEQAVDDRAGSAARARARSLQPVARPGRAA